jgi:uncharacterized protein YodC (DUF2158 family)
MIMNVGDLVELNSGGPPMKVVTTGWRVSDGEPTVTVTWSDTDGEMHRETFPVACVTKLN